ncbi:glycosyltransferase family 4 protein [Lutibacter sp. A80]|uniref:glycosyltransferase family 4 protein n=1 Tax=Lutibacter sp. A80 TaxID=2918453 RepID=UPI001F05C2EC|nr:glycosyltransferase family 4 protein [Lutibacter sp. A80]UMB61936.1 glycosyltransferase family 4 protein [Lutibacter sp. A80]
MNKKLHILFLSGWYPSRISPQNGDFIQRHAEAVATKHKVTLIYVVTDENIKSKEQTTNLINNVLTKVIYLPKASNRISKFFSFLYTYLKEINSIEDFDLTHLNITFPKGIIALYLKWFKNKPYIISEHWSGYQSPLNKSIGILQKLTTKIIIRYAKYVCPVSQNLTNSMIKFGLKGNYYNIPNVVDTTIFNTSKKKTKQFIITHISGMDDKIKNITGILNTIKKLENYIPNMKFNLIGNNSNNYKNQIKNLDIKNIYIKEQIPHKKVAEILKESNVSILFSNYENLPCVIIESFSCGVPVVSTNVGGISEFFPKEFGYLIQPKDEIALEKAILNIYQKKLISNKNEMHKYADENFGINKICKSYSNLYYKTLKSSSC